MPTIESLEEKIRNHIVRAAVSVVAKDKASVVASVRDILLLIEEEKHSHHNQLLDRVIESLPREIDMGMGFSVKYAAAKAEAWNEVLTQSKQLINNLKK